MQFSFSVANLINLRCFSSVVANVEHTVIARLNSLEILLLVLYGHDIIPFQPKNNCSDSLIKTLD